MPKKEKQGANATPSIHSNTTKEKSHAEMMFDKIGTGKENAFRATRKDHNDRVAREFRSLVKQAQINGDAIITDRDGKGYYRPNLERPEEVESARHYIASLVHEANSRMETAQAIASKLGGRYLNI